MTPNPLSAASPRPTPAVRARLGVGFAAGLLATLCLGAAAAAEQALAPGQSIELGLVELRLAFNSGVAFSLGAGLPSWLVLTVTGLITLGLAVYALRTAATVSWPTRLALSAVLAGAVGNLLDRAGDGVVTDYLHTGWFPTFNLPDVLITTGAALIVVLALRAPESSEAAP